MPEIEAAAVLDRMANPHPRMWREAVAAYVARDTEPRYWQGFLDAMCAATGYEPEYFLPRLEADVHAVALANVEQVLADTLIANRAAGIDCTESQSCWTLGYFDRHHPATTPEGGAMADAFPCERDQWWQEVEDGHRTARP